MKSSRDSWPTDLAWLRALAARLVRDPHAADDAVQDTLVLALERAPEPRTDARAWLAAVLRNVLRQTFRARARRTAREESSGPACSAPSTLEVVEELSLHRRLADEVHALAEPYRTAILLRYLRGRTTDEIARELDVPVKTVRTRLERGLAKLRERMGRDRAAWVVFLGRSEPLQALPAPFPPYLLLSMNAKTIAVLLGMSLLGGYLFLRSPAPEPAGRTRNEAIAALETSAVPALALGHETQREAVPAAVPPAPGAAAAPRSAGVPAPVRGSVRTLDGQGLAGIEVVFERKDGAEFVRAADAPRARSGPGGRFEISPGDGKGRLNVRDEHYACVGMPHLSGAPPLSEPVVVVAPSCDYAGRVLAPDGAPLARARVEVTLDESFVKSRDVGGIAVHLLQPFAGGSCDAEGAFRLERVGFVGGARLVATAEGFEPGRIELAPGSHEDLELVLAPRGAARTIHGVVLEASGVPAKGALVSLGGTSASTGLDGAFALECEDWRRDGWLRAARTGALPAELPLAEALRPSSPDVPLVLRLGPQPLAIRGRVLDAGGAPVPGAVVFSPDTTPFGLVAVRESGHAIQGDTTLEAYLNGRAGPWDSAVHALGGADGGFALEGLLDRDYAVFALDPRTLAGSGPLELRAGARDVELRLASSTSVPLAGRVVSRSGLPLAGIRITTGRRFPWRADGGEDGAWSQFPPRSPFASWSLAEPAVTSDGAGRFELPALVTSGSFLELRGPALVIGAVFELEGARDPGALEVIVDAACRFQVVLGHADEADAFSLERAGGGSIVMFLEVEGLTISAARATIDAGRSGIVLVEEGEYDVVLLSGEDEVRRERRSLRAGGLHEMVF